MSTMIDSLVVELGLDVKNFSPKARAAVDDLKKLEEAGDKRSRTIQESTKRESEALRGLTSTAVELFAVFTGATGIKDFIAGQIQAGAATGRLSRAIGVSASEISRYQGIARVYGSTAEAMANTFQSMANTFTAWTHGGLEAAPILARLQLIQTKAQELDRTNARVFNPRGSKDEYFKDLAANLKIIHDLDPDHNFASYLAKDLPGMDAGQFDMLIQGAQKLSAELVKIKGLTDAEAEASGKLQRRWEDLKVTAENMGLKVLFGVIDMMHVYSGTSKTEEGVPVVNSQKVSEMSGYQAAIASIESRGSGGYAAKGPVTSSGDRAYGKYQIMGNNIGPWSQAALGKTLSVQEFMASPEAQDAIFNHRFGQYVKQYGNPQDAASAWLTGRPLATGGNARDLNGTSGADYARRFTAALPDGGGGSTSTSIYNIGPVSVTGVKDAPDFATKLDQSLRRQAIGNQSPVGGQ